jgi:ketosteroid isomerase-like protein
MVSMIKTILALSVLSIAVAFGAAQEKQASATAEVDALLTAWHKAAATADAGTYFGSMAPGAVFLGTDVTERWTKEEFEAWAAPFFQKTSAWEYSAVRRSVSLSADGNTAWFDEDLYSKSYWPCRGSGAIEKIDGAWKIRLYSLALTIPNSAVPEIRPAVLKAFAGAGKERP